MATTAQERFRIFSACLCSNTTNHWCAKTLLAPDECLAVTGRRTEPAGSPASSRFQFFSIHTSPQSQNPLTISPHIAPPPRRLNHEPRHYNQKIHCHHFRVGPSPPAEAHSGPVANPFPCASRPQ